MQMRQFFQTMSDGEEVFVTRWIPDGEAKGIVQLSHGMVEHARRYERFGTVLAENGFVLNAHDVRGHGKTAERAEEKHTGMFGFLADKNGFERVTEDVREVLEKAKADFPGKKAVLLGHSFGSFVAQSFIETYAPLIDGCILCGTAGPSFSLVALGNIVARAIAFFKGKKRASPFLKQMAFGAYTKKIPDSVNGQEWLSRDKDAVARYIADTYCGFNPTASFYCDLTHGLIKIHKRANIRKIPSDLPILIIYGTADPVGGYGKTVEKLCAIYRKNGIQNLTVKKYDGARHELFNEINKAEVEGDVLLWLASL